MKTEARLENILNLLRVVPLRMPNMNFAIETQTN